MLRAVRFAATFDFALDPDTFAAIQRLAGELVVVSAERIAEELRKMLPHPRRASAVQLLRESGLLEVILPETKAFDVEDQEAHAARLGSAWERTLAILAALENPSYPVALAALVRELGEPDDPADQLVETTGGRWRLSNEEIAEAAWVRRHETMIRQARRIPWPRLQRVLIGKHVSGLMVLADAAARVLDGSPDDIAFCRKKLSLPPEVLNPPPLLTGNELIRAGLMPGPIFHVLLDAARDAQLDGKLHTTDEALQYALELYRRRNTAP
jgi:poly(A) polymerase